MIFQEQEKALEQIGRAEWESVLSALRKGIVPAQERWMSYDSSVGLFSPSGFSIDYFYSEFINDILRNVRRGNIDYCFHLYQVIDLLSYEPEMDISWMPEEKMFACFMVITEQQTKA